MKVSSLVVTLLVACAALVGSTSAVIHPVAELMMNGDEEGALPSAAAAAAVDALMTPHPHLMEAVTVDVDVDFEDVSDSSSSSFAAATSQNNTTPTKMKGGGNDDDGGKTLMLSFLTPQSKLRTKDQFQLEGECTLKCFQKTFPRSHALTGLVFKGDKITKVDPTTAAVAGTTTTATVAALRSSPPTTTTLPVADAPNVASWWDDDYWDYLWDDDYWQSSDSYDDDYFNDDKLWDDDYWNDDDWNPGYAIPKWLEASDWDSKGRDNMNDVMLLLQQEGYKMNEVTGSGQLLLRGGGDGSIGGSDASLDKNKKDNDEDDKKKKKKKKHNKKSPKKKTHHQGWNECTCGCMNHGNKKKKVRVRAMACNIMVANKKDITDQVMMDLMAAAQAEFMAAAQARAE